MNATRVVPILNVSDITESFAWFAKLGWTVGFHWPPNAEDKGRITFASLESGECDIFLCRDGQGGRGRGSADATGGPPQRRDERRGVWLSIWVDDVGAVYRQCHAAGLEITHPPTDEPWGVREMHVLRNARARSSESDIELRYISATGSMKSLATSRLRELASQSATGIARALRFARISSRLAAVACSSACRPSGVSCR